jgi:membrane fusion protein
MTEETPLFRQEAVDAAVSRLGSAIKPVSLSGTALTALIALILITAGVFLTTASYARKETVVGDIEPSEGAARMVSPKPGVVAKVLAHEGDRVRAGTPLFVINQDVVTDSGASLATLLDAAAGAQARALEDQISAHRRSSEQQKLELTAKRQGLLDHQAKLTGDLELQRERLHLQEQSLESFKALNARKIVSDLQYRDRQDAVIQAQQTLSAIEKDRDDTASSLGQIEAELGRLGSDLAESEAQINDSRAQVREKTATNAISKEVVLTSPKDGRVVAVQVKPGSAVTNAAALAIILPDGARLHAELWAPSRAAGFVRPGDRVRLMLDAFPYQKFGVVFGRVMEIARAPTPPAELTIPIETKESLYRIDVALEREDIDGYGKAWPFAPGMRLNADLILEKRTFLEWLLDPLYAAARRNQG